MKQYEARRETSTGTSVVLRMLLVAVLLGGCTKIAESSSASPASSSSAAAATVSTPAPTTATPRPTPTPEPTIRKKIGASVEYADGWKVTAVRWSDQPPARFTSPKPGNRFIVVLVRYDNATNGTGHFNAYDWKVQDSAGVRRDQALFVGRDDLLSSGELAAGGFVAGAVVFEVPSGDAQLLLIYQAIQYRQAIWELY